MLPVVGEIVSAQELVVSGRCSGSCLVGRLETAPSCTCTCGGAYHGALADSELEILQPQPSRVHWWDRCGRGGWSMTLVNELSTLLGPAVESFNENYREQMENRGIFHAVVRRGRSNYEVHWDLEWKGEWSVYDRHSRAALHHLSNELLQNRRCRVVSAYPDSSGAGFISGFGDETEARLVECLIGEAHSGNPCGAVRAVWGLRGRDLDRMFHEGGHPERAHFPDTCGACGLPALYDAVDDIYRHESSTTPLREMPATSRTLACYLDIQRGS